MGLVFSDAEMRNRVARAQDLIKKEKFDALLISGEDNFQYFTGISGTLCLHASHSRPAVVVVPDDGSSIAVVGNLFEDLMRLSAVGDVRTYQSTTGVPVELYVSALKDAGLTNKKIGIEQGLETRLGQPLGELMGVLKALPDVTFADASSLIWQLRMVKSSEEVDLMKKAAEITGKARQKTFDQIKDGMTHREIARLFSKLMFEYGADRVGFIHVGTKHIPVNHTQLHSDIRVSKGDAIYLDGGAYVRTHTIDFPRIAVLGKATEELEKSHESIRKVSVRMANFMKPGISCSELWKVGQDAMKEVGMGFHTIGRTGHGQGILVTEPPSVAPHDRTILKRGMVVSTEPTTRVGEMWMFWEDVHVVTEDGHEQISLETDVLREID
jgi:Xaa-Pro aminopeptidase